MEYEIQDNLLKTISRQFMQPVQVWRQVALFIVFGLLLVFVILSCTVSPSPLLAIALTTMLIIVALALWRPYFALLLVFTAAGMPMPRLLTPLPVHPVRPIEWALLLCIIVIIILRSSLPLRLPHLLALLFIAIAIISFIHAPDISSDYYSSSKRLYEVILVIIAFFCGTFLLRYVKNISSFLVAILLSNIPLYLIGLGQAVGIHVSILEYGIAPNIVDGRIIGPTTGGRIMGPTAGSVIFGSYLINLLAVALACWMLGIRRRDRTIGAIMAVITALEIALSGTRSSVIAAIIAIIFALIFTRHFKMLLGILTLAGVTIAPFFNQLLPLFIHNDDATRPFLWQEAIKLIATHPWIGIGLNQFAKYYTQELIVGTSIRLSPLDINVHELYLGWGMESGIFCMIIGVLLLLSIIFSCWKAYRLAHQKQQALLLAAILAVLANMVAGIFDQPLSYVENGVFFFLLAGLALGYVEDIHRVKAIQGKITNRAPSPLPQVISAIGKGSMLYPRLSRKPRIGLPVPSQSSPDAIVVTTTDAVPNTQKTTRTIIFQLLSWAIAIPIIFPMTALLTRYLGTVQYGEYSFTFTFFAIFALLSGTGMDPLIIRKLSRQKTKDWSNILSYAAGTRLLSSAFSASAAALLALILPVSAEQRNLLLLGSVSLFFSFSFNGLRTIYSHGFRAEQKANFLFLLETTDRVLTAGLVLIVVLLHLSILWAYCLLIYSDIPFFLIQVLIARRRFGIRLRFSLTRAKEYLLASLPLTGYDALALINGQVDLILLLVLVGPSSVGIYALASRITDPLLSIVFAYTNGLYPLLCTKFEEGREQFAIIYYEATRILSLGIIPLAIFVSVEANAIVVLLGGQNFAAAAPVVQLLMWAMAVSFLHLFAVRTATAANMDRFTPYITVTSTGLNMLVNLLLIPHWGYIGAGMAALSSEVIGLCLYSILLARYVHLLKILGVLLRILLGNLPMLAFLLWQPKIPLLIAAPIGIVLTIVGYIATHALSLKDVQLAQQILHARRGIRMTKDVYDQPTTILPRIQDVADWPTIILPRIQI